MKRAARLSLLFAIMTLPASAVFCQSNSAPRRELTLQQYLSELDRCSEVLNKPQTDPAAYRKLRATLPAEWTVADGGQTYTIDTDWLTSALVALRVNSLPSNLLLQETRQRLAALRDAAGSLEDQQDSIGLQQAHVRLDHILSAKEFQGAHGPSWFDVLRARLYAWIWKQIEKLLQHFRHGREVGNAIAWSLIVLATLLLALWAVSASLRGGKQTEMDLEGGPRPEGGWQDWLRNARAAAERGDYRPAIHAAYWAGVLRLEDLHRLPQDRARTPREALRLIRRDSAEYVPLAQLTKRFELIWYGYRSATENDWTDAMQQLEKLGCLPSSTPAIAAC